MNFRKPFEKNFLITQKFGEKYLYYGKEQFHRGLDFACPEGTPILSVHKGKVERVRRDEAKNGYGFEVRIAGEGCLTQYAHLSEIAVEEGKEVQVGDQLGLSGNTGFCLGKTGFHLHFGLKRDGVWVDPLPEIEESLKSEPEEDEPEDVEKSDGATNPPEEELKSESVGRRED